MRTLLLYIHLAATFTCALAQQGWKYISKTLPDAIFKSVFLFLTTAD
jgi:hypothetical protein